MAARGDTVSETVVDCHGLSFLRDLHIFTRDYSQDHSNPAAIAVMFSQNDSVAPWLACSVAVAEPCAAAARGDPGSSDSNRRNQAAAGAAVDNSLVLQYHHTASIQSPKDKSLCAITFGGRGGPPGEAQGLHQPALAAGPRRRDQRKLPA